MDIFSDEAEMCALGSCFYTLSDAENVFSKVGPTDFWRPTHQVLATVIQLLIAKRVVPDLVSVWTALSSKQQEECGGQEYLIQIMEMVPSPASAGYYAQIVRNFSIFRALDQAATEIRALVSTHSEREASETLDQAKAFLADLHVGEADYFSLRDLAIEEFQYIDKAMAGEAKPGIKTGLLDVDAYVDPGGPGQIITIAARPGQGKTALMMTMAAWMADNGHTGLICSLEMSRGELTRRAFSALATETLPNSIYRDSDTSEKIYQAVSIAADWASQLPLYIMDQGDMTVPAIRARARQLQMTVGLDFIWVDYLQIVASSSKKEGKHWELAEIMQQFKTLAKDLGVTIYILSQLNRNVEKRENKRPQLSDVAESGSIEAASDVLIGLYREAYYKPRADADADSVEPVELIVLKQRNGITSKTAIIGFHPARKKFVNLARYDIERYRESIKEKD